MAHLDWNDLGSNSAKRSKRSANALVGSDKQLDGGWSVTFPAVTAASECFSAQRCPWEPHLWEAHQTFGSICLYSGLIHRHLMRKGESGVTWILDCKKTFKVLSHFLILIIQVLFYIFLKAHTFGSIKACILVHKLFAMTFPPMRVTKREKIETLITIEQWIACYFHTVSTQNASCCLEWSSRFL